MSVMLDMLPVILIFLVFLFIFINKLKKFLDYTKYKEVHCKIEEIEMAEDGSHILKSVSYNLNGQSVIINHMNNHYVGDTDYIILYVNKDDIHDYKFESVKPDISSLKELYSALSLVPFLLILGGILLLYLIVFFLSFFAS